MTTFIVIRKADQTVVFQYDAEAATEWGGFEFDTHDHIPQQPAEPPAPPPVNPAEWHIGVGPFWDRFGQYKIAILASADPVVQAIIKDSSVRKYLDLKGRRADLDAALTVLIAKGFPLDKSVILDTKPGPLEVFSG